MLKNNKGFTFVESVSAFIIIITFVTVMLPMLSLIKKERINLLDRIDVTYRLHDKLLYYLWENELVFETVTETVNKQEVTFTFDRYDDLVRSCANWENANNKKEQICLYGFPENS